jgi:hypothetical protein
MLHAAGILVLVFIGVLAASVVWHGVGPLHWGRFFFRGWVVLSLMWAATVGVVGWGGIVAPLPPPEDPRCVAPGNFFDVFDNGPVSDECLRARQEMFALAEKGQYEAPKGLPAPLSLMIERAGHVAAVALLPPAGLLILGFACAWVLRGLRGSARA